MKLHCILERDTFLTTRSDFCSPIYLPCLAPLTKPPFEIKFNSQPMQASQAEVAELADALRSGRSESNLMRVQVPPSAQNQVEIRCEAGFLLPAPPHPRHFPNGKWRGWHAVVGGGQWYN